MYFQYRSTVHVNNDLSPNGAATEASKRVKAIKHESLTALIRYCEPAIPEDGDYDVVIFPAEVDRHFLILIRIGKIPNTKMHYIREVLG